jgi:tetratricopeptide (TPR) repeat protein
MQTRLSRICDAIIEAGWLAALIVTPLFFNTFSNRVFEPDKLHLLRSIALAMAVAWGIQLLDTGLNLQKGGPGVWARLRATPLVLPTLLLVGSYLLSTALSVVPRISFFGSYVRMQGTLSFLSYVLIFAAVLTHLRSRAQVDRILHAIILVSLPISIYGIMQQAGLDPLPWGGDVRDRVAANMGNSIFVAAYLIMAVFLTLERLLDSLAALFSAEQGSVADALRAGAYLFILVVQFIAIVYTQSRGPWLGLAAGLYMFSMLGLLLLARLAAGRSRVPAILGWLGRNVRAAWLGLIGLTLAGVVFLVLLNVPQGPLKGLCEKRYVGRVCTLFSTTSGTNAVRVLIWEGVVDMMLKPHSPIQTPDGQPDRLNVIRPLVGYGPESMWVAYNRFYPPDLAHYESRNASPDRSHNETFDALVRGGFLQFGIQIFLYCSLFYYALRWLGLMQGRGRRNLFIALLIAGGALGVIVPVLADHSLRLAGIGLPAGLIVGMIVYVTVDLLLSGRGEVNNAQESRGGVPAPVAVRQQAGGRRQLLILALFAAIVAHFAEVHFGIAIASTLTLFWVLAGALVAVGMGWTERTADVQVEPAPAALKPQPSGKPQPAGARPQSGSGKAQPAGGSAHKSRGGKTARSADSPRPGSAQAAQRAEFSARVAPRSPLVAVLPYAGIGALVTLVLAWDYVPLSVSTGAQGAFSFLWDAFTTRADSVTSQVVRSPMLLVLMIFTWLVGGLLAVAESSRVRRWGAGLAIYFGTTVGAWLVYGLIEAGRMTTQGLSGLDVFRHMAGHIVFFDLCLLLVGLGLAVALLFADTRPRPARAFGRTPVLSLGGGLTLGIIALFVIINVNTQTVQADTYYKQGLAYEGAGQWEGAVVLYQQAAELEPDEDYYYLFLGRALLQLSETAQAGDALLPADLTDVPTSDLLSLIGRGVRSGNREDLTRAAQAALIGAQRLNPLNTDHSANLARLNRSWAFTGALGPNDSPTSGRLREILTTQPDKVDRARLDQSLNYYRQATSLSPQNAQLWNELATVQLITDDLAAARASVERSLALDQRFTATYLLKGDVLDAAGDKQGALDAYRQAAALAPKDLSVLSAVGVFSAQTGDLQGALDAFNHIVDVSNAAVKSAQTQLDRLDQEAAQAGGYSGLLPSAASRRDALQNQIASYGAQLHLAYRNLALVLRDAGRTSEALTAAQQALGYASDADRSTVESLIADLKQRLGQ